MDIDAAVTTETETPTAATSASIQICRLDVANAARWDAFVDNHPEASFFHRAAWGRVVQRAFGHTPYYLYAESDGRIVGLLPLGQVRSMLFGNALISAPFGVYGGVVAHSEAARRVLEAAAESLARELGVDYLELRYREAQETSRLRKDLYVTFRKEIDPDPDKNLLAIPRKQRAMVRKGIDAGLVGHIDPHVDRFYEAYAESVRNLGTPVFAKKYFRILKEEFGEDCEILTITHEGKVVSSVLSFYFRDQVLPYYGGGTRDARRVAANDFMYWELMRRACQRGIRLFDFGRSKQGTGSYSFKKNWGFTPEPMHYEYYLVKARAIPEVNPLNPKYRLMVNVWRRLPLGVSKLIGPWIARSLG